jgi:hypothetical protein
MRDRSPAGPRPKAFASKVSSVFSSTILLPIASEDGLGIHFVDMNAK